VVLADAESVTYCSRYPSQTSKKFRGGEESCQEPYRRTAKPPGSGHYTFKRKNVARISRWERAASSGDGGKQAAIGRGASVETEAITESENVLEP